MKIEPRSFIECKSMDEFYGHLSDSQALIYDIETEPLPLDQIAHFFDKSKVKLPDRPADFDVSAIKYGNIKNESLKQEKRQQARESHQTTIRVWQESCRKKTEQAYQDFVDSAALSAMTSRLCAIGYGAVKQDALYVYLDMREDDEEMAIAEFFMNILSIDSRGSIIGFNDHTFDLPYVIRRSWKYPNVCTPPLFNNYWKLPNNFIDLKKEWKMGDARANIRLTNLCKYFGVRDKLEGMTGDMFHQVLKEDWWTAYDYLLGDILSTYECAVKIGACNATKAIWRKT